MSNVDKIFKWVSIALPIVIVLPFVLVLISLMPKQYNQFIASIFLSGLFLFAINSLVSLLGILFLIYVFFKKLFTKNKTKKDWLIIVFSLLSAIIYGGFIFIWIVGLIISQGLE